MALRSDLREVQFAEAFLYRHGCVVLISEWKHVSGTATRTPASMKQHRANTKRTVSAKTSENEVGERHDRESKEK